MDRTLDLVNYAPESHEDSSVKDRILNLIKEKEDCYWRSCFEPGHITASAVLTSHDGKRVLMNHHKFLNLWLCFGGHADGDTDTQRVAIRETIEESGIQAVEPILSDILDLDIHKIPENPSKGEPAHFHHDVRYLLRVCDPAYETFSQSEESHALSWFSFEEALSLCASDPSMIRLLQKTQKVIHNKDQNRTERT